MRRQIIQASERTVVLKGSVLLFNLNVTEKNDIDSKLVILQIAAALGESYRASIAVNIISLLSLCVKLSEEEEMKPLISLLPLPGGDS